MSLLLKSTAATLVLASMAALAPRGSGPVERAWTSRGFEENLRAAADQARLELCASPEIVRADVHVKSVDDHEPLRVEASIAWAAADISMSRREEIRSRVRSRFEAFACVTVVLADDPKGTR